jgi:hypothetical protein
MSSLVRLYPRAWRDRYETEFRGLLQARPPTAGDRLDIVRGAIDARLHGEIPGSPRLRSPIGRLERLSGAAALVAGLSLTAWIGLILRDFRGWDREEPAAAALIGALAAISLLALAAAHALFGLAGSARMRPFGPIAASIAVACFAITVFGGGVTLAYAIVASMALAAAMGGRSIPVGVAIAWIVSSLTMIAAMLGFVGSDGTNLGLLPFLVPFGLVWMLIGLIVTIRGLPTTATATAITSDAPPDARQPPAA